MKELHFLEAADRLGTGIIMHSCNADPGFATFSSTTLSSFSLFAFDNGADTENNRFSVCDLCQLIQEMDLMLSVLSKNKQ